MRSIGDIYQEFLSLEEELHLFEQEIAGVRFWEYARVPLILGVYSHAIDPTSSHSSGPRLMARILFLIRSFFSLWRSPIFSSRKTVLFICSPRRILGTDGKWWDPYTDYIMEDLKCSHAAIEHNFNLKHFRPARTRALYDFDLLDSLLYVIEKLRLLRVPFRKREKELLRKVRGRIGRLFGLDVDVEQITRRLLEYRRLRILYFQFVLRRIRPKGVVLVTSYGKEDLIEAAKSMRIPVIELQHGVVHPYHPAYSFPGPRKIKRSFPDWLLTFGDYFTECVEYPIEKNRVLSMGYPFLDEEMKRFSHFSRKRQILVISQWTIANALSKFAVELSEIKNLGYHVVYKLHPLEQEGWRTKYPWLDTANIEVIDDGRTSLYQLFAESEIQLGVYSTAIYEGLAFGLRTYLPNLPGIEYSEPLVQTGVAVKVETAKDMVHHILHGERAADFDRNQFFRSGAKDRILRFLGRVLSPLSDDEIA